MIKKAEQAIISETFIGHMRNLRDLSCLISVMEDKIAELSDRLGGICERLEISETASAAPEPKDLLPEPGKHVLPEHNAQIRNLSNIIAFPSNSRRTMPGAGSFTNPAGRRGYAPISGRPGSPLPPGIPDFRGALQRDGLILLAWDKRGTESGERYTAYWVTSTGTPRFYASKPLAFEEFPAAQPHHKSYAAEDGIEFYGQKAPEYIVHAAPELLISNPAHRELRSIHIDTLKREGSGVDFGYQYLLTRERKRLPPCGKNEGGDDQRVG